MLSLRTVSLVCAGVAGVLLVAAFAGFIEPRFTAPSGLAAALLAAFGLGAIPPLKGYQYTAWIIAAIVAGMLYPQNILYVGDFDMRSPWLIMAVIQLVMFGMGTQMRLTDFQGVVRSPRGVAIGLLCQFSIMPTMGWLLTQIFNFPLEIAAGIILIGSCSSGLASNVMAYIAKANLALSITVTAVATIVAPVATPLLMKLLASTFVDIKFIDMMLSIVKITLAPISAALLADYLNRSSAPAKLVLRLTAAACALWLAFYLLGGENQLSPVLSPEAALSVHIFGFFAGAIVAGTVYHAVRAAFPSVQSFMPYLSMFGIVYFTTVTTAAGRDYLLQVGGLLLLAAVIHNTAGYILGYWFSRLFGLDEASARTMALEVGMQNGGMASGIAGEMGKLGTLGLAAAVFSPWMNISGSILANIWSRIPVTDSPRTENEKSAQA